MRLINSIETLYIGLLSIVAGVCSEVALGVKNIRAKAIGEEFFKQKKLSSKNFLWDTRIAKKDTISTQRIMVYPNPIINYLVIEWENTADEMPLKFTLQNVIGKTIREETIKGSKSKIEMGDLDPGIYFISISNNGYTLLSRKILKK